MTDLRKNIQKTLNMTKITVGLALHWQIQGVPLAHTPLRVQILSFRHTNFMKCSHLRSWHFPLWKILDPSLHWDGYLYQTKQKNVSLWDLVALKEPRIVLRGCNVLLRSLESLMCMYTAVRWTVVVSLSCVGSWNESLLMNVTANRWERKFWGLEWSHFWWILLCMVQNMLSWGLKMSQIVACDVSSSACPKIKSEFHCVLWVLTINVSGGSLPWRLNTVNLKVVSHGDWRCYIIQYEGLERSQFRWCWCIVHCMGLEMSRFRCKTLGSWKESISM